MQAANCGIGNAGSKDDSGGNFPFEMRIVQLGRSLCYAYYSFVFFNATFVLQEIAYDQLPSERESLPGIMVLVQFFEPVDFFIFGFPILIGITCWRCLKRVGPSFQLILTHFLLIGIATVVLASLVLAYGSFVYMDGVHPTTGIQKIGSLVIGIGLIAAIVHSYRKERRCDT